MNMIELRDQLNLKKKEISYIKKIVWRVCVKSKKKEEKKKCSISQNQNYVCKCNGITNFGPKGDLYLMPTNAKSSNGNPKLHK